MSPTNVAKPPASANFQTGNETGDDTVGTDDVVGAVVFVGCGSDRLGWRLTLSCRLVDATKATRDADPATPCQGPDDDNNNKSINTHNDDSGSLCDIDE